ncbi:MAG: DUF6157 family protein [Chloroflexota bacterium]
MVYTDTFIQIAPDSDTTSGIVPESNRPRTPIHIIEYRLLSQQPYHFDQDDLIYEVHLIRQGISDEERAERGDQIRAELFQKGHPCLRASALTKRYGWGAHYDEHGKIALYAVDSDEYKQLSETVPNQLLAMRSKRKK